MGYHEYLKKVEKYLVNAQLGKERDPKKCLLCNQKYKCIADRARFCYLKDSDFAEQQRRKNGQQKTPDYFSNN